MGAWNELIKIPVVNMLNKIAEFIPYLLGAIIILIAGWVVANLLSGLVRKGLDSIKFNDISMKIGLSDLLYKGGVSLSPSALIAAVVYWALMIVTLAITVDAIGLQVAAQLLERVSGYIPNVASAIFVMIVGMFLANLISGVVRATVSKADLPRSEFLSGIARAAILVFTTVVVLEELNIASFFVTTTFQIFFAATCFALALAFGLGGKDLAAKILWDFFNKQSMNK